MQDKIVGIEEKMLEVSTNDLINTLSSYPAHMSRFLVLDGYIYVRMYRNGGIGCDKKNKMFSETIDMFNRLNKDGWNYGQNKDENNYAIAYLYYLLAECDFESQDYYSAISNFSKSLDFDPSLYQVFGRMGEAKFKLGDKVGACNDWNKTVSNKNIDENFKTYYGNLIKENCN